MSLSSLFGRIEEIGYDINTAIANKRMLELDEELQELEQEGEKVTSEDMQMISDIIKLQSCTGCSWSEAIDTIVKNS